MPKKIPMRMCVGCREMHPKQELIRVVCSPQGVVSLDFKGKAPGRGAYICRNTPCFERAVKTRALDRALDIKLPEEIINALKGALLIDE